MRRAFVMGTLVERVITSFVIVFGMTIPQAHPWGLIGHRMVAEEAARLISKLSPQWGGVLHRHRFFLGIHAGVPDLHFRTHSEEVVTHFYDLDLPLATPRLPSHGTLPKRIEQLRALARAHAQQLERLPAAPTGYQTFIRSPHAPIKALGQWMEYLGILAHYTGDAAVPFHATQDSNGFSIGQGGIHFYYESDCLIADEAHLLRELQAQKPKPHQTITLDRVLEESLKLVPDVLRVDLKNAVLKRQPNDSREFATRRPPEAGCIQFRRLLVRDLARAVNFTAAVWLDLLPSISSQTTDVLSKITLSDYQPTPTWPVPH